MGSAALASLPPAWPRASYTQLEGSRRAGKEGRVQWHTPQYFQEEEGQHGLHAGSHGKDLTSTQTPPNCSNRPFCARAHRASPNQTWLQSLESVGFNHWHGPLVGCCHVAEYGTDP